jgi:iron-sulfur cluster assembly accessory protein
MRTPVTLSETAARRLHTLVEAGGCSGFSYKFDLIDHAEPDDLKIERDGAAAVVDVVSLALLNGSEIDFVDELAGAEFRIHNPNARSSCGCGVSFSI